MRVRFDAFTLDAGTRQLSRSGQEVHLSPKAFDLLALLLAERPAVVSKEVLRDRLWGATNVVDANLNNLASEIRAALGDDPHQPRYLRTAHRVGYAFCGQASDVAEDSRSGPQCWLVWKDRTLVLSAVKTTIGRDPDCAIWIDVPGVSRRHAVIRLESEGDETTASIEDLDSTNGTFVDNRRVRQPATLNDGASIRVGEATLTFRTRTSAAAPTKRIRRR